MHAKSWHRAAARLATGTLFMAVCLIGSAPAANAAANDIDGDGAADTVDNCLVVANPSQRDKNRNRVGDDCDGTNSRRTVAQLRAMPLAALDRVMAVTKPGPMPAYESEAKGHVRWMPDAAVDPVLQTVFMQAWQGKIWYTKANGGFLLNRMVADIPVHYHKVHYGISPADGRAAIIVEPGFPVDQFYDMIRIVQPGIYLGYSMLRPNYGVQLPANTRMLSFVLDFNDPTIRSEECVQCKLGLKELGLKVLWPTGPANPLGLAPGIK